MTEEEKAEEYVLNLQKKGFNCFSCFSCDFSKNLGFKSGVPDSEFFNQVEQAYLAGLKAGRPEWHKVADGDLPKGDDSFGKTSIHRKIYLKDRHGNLYTGNYYPKDESHREDCFAVEFLDWGFQGAQFCAKGQISEWCEIPQYTEE